MDFCDAQLSYHVSRPWTETQSYGHYILLHKEQLQLTYRNLHCPNCNQKSLGLAVDEHHGLAVKLRVQCNSCRTVIDEVYSSPAVATNEASNAQFEVNKKVDDTLSRMGMQTFGWQKMCSALDLSNAGDPSQTSEGEGKYTPLPQLNREAKNKRQISEDGSDGFESVGVSEPSGCQDYSKRRKAQKKKRLCGQKITPETPLPTFSPHVLAELAKTTPRMSVVLPECKAYIIEVTGDAYPTKKEYDHFSLNMVMKYPSLRDPDTANGFGCFKKSLSASFRGGRSYLLNQKLKRMRYRELALTGKITSSSTVAERNEPPQPNLTKEAGENLSQLNFDAQEEREPPQHHFFSQDEQEPSDLPNNFLDGSILDQMSEEDEMSDGFESAGMSETNSSQDACERKRRKAQKKGRLSGQRITPETPLPTFSPHVLDELAKPNPRMSVVLPPCKAHIVEVTGDAYPTKKEYDHFSLNMILKYPSLADPDTTNGYLRFKKSLSASFRTARSYILNIKTRKQQLRKSMPAVPIPDPTSMYKSEHTGQEEAEKADEELRGIDYSLEPARAQFLIQKSLTVRRRAITIPQTGFDEITFLTKYPHLCNYDLLLYEYSLIVSLNVKEIRDNFEEGMVVLKRMYGDSGHETEDLKRIYLLVELQEHLLKASTSDPKLLLSVKNMDEVTDDMSIRPLTSQDPCAVVLVNGCNIEKSIIFFKDNIVLEKQNPSAFDIVSSLLAFYFTLNIKYPSAYADLLKALERLLNRKLCVSSLQIPIRKPYNTYVKLYEAHSH